MTEYKPCPFCGGRNISEASYNDEGEKLEDWMLDDYYSEEERPTWGDFISTCAYTYLR